MIPDRFCKPLVDSSLLFRIYRNLPESRGIVQNFEESAIDIWARLVENGKKMKILWSRTFKDKNDFNGLKIGHVSKYVTIQFSLGTLPKLLK